MANDRIEITSRNSHSSTGRLRRLIPERKFELKLMMPVFKNLMFNMIKIAPEKMIAGSMYFSSMKKLPDLLITIKRVAAATKSNIIKYQKF
jgi:hypothetical protein